jgi:hypothetical protein
VTDPDARLARRGEGKEARLSCLGHVLIDNRKGLGMDHRLTRFSGSAIDGSTTRRRSYKENQVYRHRVEQVFGWTKAFGLTHKVRHRDLKRVSWMFAFTVATYNLARMRNLELGVATRKTPRKESSARRVISKNGLKRVQTVLIPGGMRPKNPPDSASPTVFQRSPTQ